MKSGWLLPLLFLASCSATTPPPYQADRAPEDRDSYNGPEGMSQYAKDQSYLQEKTLSDNCQRAKLDLVEAESDNDSNAAKQANKSIDENCINQAQ